MDNWLGSALFLPVVVGCLLLCDTRWLVSFFFVRTRGGRCVCVCVSLNEEGNSLLFSCTKTSGVGRGGDVNMVAERVRVDDEGWREKGRIRDEKAVQQRCVFMSLVVVCVPLPTLVVVSLIWS